MNTIEEEIKMRTTKSEIFSYLLSLIKEEAIKKERADAKKKLYYISAEFLIGKLLSNHLINLGLYDRVEQALQQKGMSISQIEELEPEPSLGNGGLGRLAACYLDSAATLGLCVDGVGLNYHFGLFHQTFDQQQQVETKDPWIQTPGFLIPTDVSFPVTFHNQTVQSVMYDLAVTGYDGTTNRLHLFDIQTVNESLVTEGIEFDKTKTKENLTLFLYPDDSTEDGKLLRLYQEYFMVSNAAQLILKEALEKGSTLHDLEDYAVIQINDTHPTMIIPELIRLLTLHEIPWREAVKIVSSICAYTNHTIMAEALETWPIAALEKVVPQLVPIIKRLDQRIKRNGKNPKTDIIDAKRNVHMANLDIHYGFSVNGVAALHTQILETSELKDFYKLYPERFHNVTNGITFRRWLMCCNRPLTQLIEKHIGTGFYKDAMQLEKLMAYQEDPEFCKELLLVKQQAKHNLCNYLKKTQNITIDETSVFDIQAKRLHEYKRQQMNALYIIDRYLKIKAGKIQEPAVTFFFGAKAAPAYTIAKDIIHLILCLQKLIAADETVNKYLNIVMIENYNVSAAQQLIPACDLSEQISLASKEASGTGNMKFMLNGAVTIGTMDGANVEIHDLVKDDNIYIFGASSDEVIAHYQKEDYHPEEILKAHPELKQLVDFIVGDELMQIGCKENLERLHKELVNKDWFMTLLDLQEYMDTKQKALTDWKNRDSWAKKMVVNIANAGFFSSDRCIREYNETIWKLS